jgi:hypothetical protein
MHARVTTISGSPDGIDAGISNFNSEALPGIREVGGQGGILLVDRSSGKTMAITLWPDEEAMRASEEAANELRRRVTEQMSAGEPQVDRYEVAVFET